MYKVPCIEVITVFSPGEIPGSFLFMDYQSKRWEEKRKHILRRDKWIDQVLLRQGVKREATLVHHILPAMEYPEYQWEDWNLISVHPKTHRRLHDIYSGRLSKFGEQLMRETALEHGVPLIERILIIGHPGSGKSTQAKKILKGGICYELDSIASAFRLTTPHSEQEHVGAKRMAAALRRGWLEAAPMFSNRIIVVRGAPDIDELEETNPTKLIVCTKHYVERPYSYDKQALQEKIDSAIEWAKLNGIEVETL